VLVVGAKNGKAAKLAKELGLNPVFAGDRPDPTVLRDGNRFLLTTSSFESIPGLMLWSSPDLVNWEPLGPALRTYVGSVWAPDLCRFGDRYFIYFPARTAEGRSNYVIWADRPEGPWSAPVDLRLPRHIDPGHAVGEDGERYLFLSGGDRVRLSPDGLSTVGNVEHVNDPWRYPDDWVVEAFAPEGPKVCRRDGYFYLVTAVGGTAGPPTGHMVVVSRSRSIHGPWENCPHNPLVRTHSAAERWWSRGHATLLEAPDGRWWMLYHGYENGFWTLGRQMLLDPVEWTADGWPVARGGDLSQPLVKPVPGRGPHGQPCSDDFHHDRMGTLWAFYLPGPDEARRYLPGPEGLRRLAKGTTPSDSSPLCLVAGDHAYELEVELVVGEGAEGGLLLFYSKRLYAGLGVDADGLVMHRYGVQRRSRPPAGFGRRQFIRLRNDRHIVTLHTSNDGHEWTKFGVQMEVSGYHHNTMGEFLSLRPALYAAGSGEVTFRHFRYRAL
jgi:beta-xylosidase